MIFDLFPPHFSLPSLPYWKIHVVAKVNRSVVGTKPIFKWPRCKAKHNRINVKGNPDSTVCVYVGDAFTFESQMLVSLANSMFSDITVTAGNWPWWENMHSKCFFSTSGLPRKQLPLSSIDWYEVETYNAIIKNCKGQFAQLKLIYFYHCDNNGCTL